MEPSFKINLEKLCRACRVQTENLKSIYDSIIPISNNIQSSLANMLTECASVKVHIDDGLPSSMCESCVEKLRQAFEFKIECQHTDSFLRILLEKNDQVAIKTENIDDFSMEFPEEKFNIEEEKVFATALEETPTYKPEKTRTTDSSLKVYFCTICDKRFNRLDHVKRHMIVHLKNKPYICRICKRGFNHMDKLCRHETLCKGDRIYVCDICNRSFNRPDALEAHKETHNSEDVRPMLESLANIERYILVQNVESKEITALQSIDIQGVTGELDFYEDLKNVDEDNSFSDTECAEKVSDAEKSDSESVVLNSKRGRPSKTDLKLGKRRKKIIYFSKNPPCPICHKKFKLGSLLKRHMVCHIENKPFSCPHCSKKFARKDHMSRHAKLHANQKEFKCDLCYREFSKQQQLQQHKAIKHNIGERQITEKRFKCDICAKGFTTEKYRDVHVRAHQGEKLKGYQCKNCDAAFEFKRDLLQHEKQSVDCSKKFLCSECGQRFIRKNYLVVHMRRHRGEKPYKCKYCGKGLTCCDPLLCTASEICIYILLS